MTIDKLNRANDLQSTISALEMALKNDNVRFQCLLDWSENNVVYIPPEFNYEIQNAIRHIIKECKIEFSSL